MKTLVSLVVFLSFYTLSFAQMAMNTVAIDTAPAAAPLSEKAMEALATKQTKSLINQLGDIISTHVAYSELLIENAIEGELVLKLTFTRIGKLAAIQVIESPHIMLTDMVVKAIDYVGLEDFGHETYYGPEAIMVPISFSLR